MEVPESAPETEGTGADAVGDRSCLGRADSMFALLMGFQRVLLLGTHAYILFGIDETDAQIALL